MIPRDRDIKMCDVIDIWTFTVGSFWIKIKSLGISTVKVQVSHDTF